MNQLKIILLIILLILLVCINRKKEKFGCRKDRSKYKKERNDARKERDDAKTERNTRERLLDRCTDDLERLINKFDLSSLGQLGITQETPQNTLHGVDSDNNKYKVEYDKSLKRSTKRRFPIKGDFSDRSIFSDMAESDVKVGNNTGLEDESKQTIHSQIDTGLFSIAESQNQVNA